MQIDSIKFKGHRCFREEFSGFDQIRPINVIIGRNNSGKSHLIDLVKTLCDDSVRTKGWGLECAGVLSENAVAHHFPKTSSGGVLGGNFWSDHGRHIVGKRVQWVFVGENAVQSVELDSDFVFKSPFGEQSNGERKRILHEVLKGATHSLKGKHFRHILADRDISTEPATLELSLGPSGRGATNIIRRFLLTSHPNFSRDVVQATLLSALNQVFGSDGEFTEIQVTDHDEPLPGQQKGHWEVCLGEKHKGLVPLSNSGSGLKTILLVLLNLLVIPKIEAKSPKHYVFAFEELENNLHPALLRRLLLFIEEYAVSEKATVFLTTHSSAALDLFGVSENSQIVHVTHNGKTAVARQIIAHFDRLGVVGDLGIRPSDILQANGIVWVEGPSDRIYMKQWINLVSDGELREGKDYQCAYYGGALLGSAQFRSPEQALEELVNLIQVNPNVAVICDSDRDKKRARLKPRVKRIEGEVRLLLNGFLWITDAREIENYISGGVWSRVFNLGNLPDPGQFESIFTKKKESEQSYIERHLRKASVDKVELALQSAPLMTREELASRFDWEKQMTRLVERIRSWNG